MGLKLCHACLIQGKFFKSIKAIVVRICLLPILSYLRGKDTSILQFKPGATILKSSVLSLCKHGGGRLCAAGERLAGGVTGLFRELHWEEIMNVNEEGS